MSTLSQWKHTYPYKQLNESSGGEREDQAIHWWCQCIPESIKRKICYCYAITNLYLSKQFYFLFLLFFSPSKNPATSDIFQESSQITWLLMGHLMYLETSSVNTGQNQDSPISLCPRYFTTVAKETPQYNIYIKQWIYML